MPWIRLQTDFHRRPKLKKAGYWARAVLQTITMIAKDSDHRGGKLSDDYWDAEYIAEFMGLTDHDDYIRGGMSKCVEAGFVVPGPGHITIPGWKKYQIDPTASDRKAKQREKEKSHDSHSDSRGVTVTDECHGDIHTDIDTNKEREIPAPAPVQDDHDKEIDHITGLIGELTRYILSAFPQYDEYSAMMTAQALRPDAEKIDWKATVDAVAKRWQGDIKYGGQDRLRNKLVNWFEAERDGRFKKAEDKPAPRPLCYADDDDTPVDDEPIPDRDEVLGYISGLKTKMTMEENNDESKKNRG
jgi:hypothetical protein